MLPFSSRVADYHLPEIGPGEEKVLVRFIQLYEKKGNVLDRLVKQAREKLEFDETSVRFWAPFVVGGRLGPLEPLLSDPEVEEIMVNGIGKPVFIYHRKKGMVCTGLVINEPAYFLEIANRILSPLGRRVDESHPRASGVLSSGDRVSVLIPPYSRDFVMDIRRFSVEPLTILDLIRGGMLSYEDAALLWLVFERGDVNVGIVGNTGSGKTTLLNALTRFIPKSSRILLVEEVPEIKPLQDQVVSLISVDPLGLTMRDAIIDSLRLRPDRTIIGEVRSDEEVRALHESCLAGQALGTYFTYHAESADEARRRLVAQGFPEHDLSSIDLLVVVRRSDAGGKAERKVVDMRWNSSSIDLSGVKERADWLREQEDLSDRDLFIRIQEYERNVR